MLFPTCLKWTQCAHPSIHSDPKVFIPLILITYYCLGDQVVVLSLVVGRSGSGSVEKSQVVSCVILPSIHSVSNQSEWQAIEILLFFFQLLSCLVLVLGSFSLTTIIWGSRRCRRRRCRLKLFSSHNYIRSQPPPPTPW